MTFNDLKKLPLAEFCINELKYTIDEKGDCRRWRCLQASNGRNIIIKSTPLSSGDYMWRYQNPEKGEKADSVIGLLTTVEKLTYAEITDKYLTTNISSRLPKEKVTPQDDKPKYLSRQDIGKAYSGLGAPIDNPEANYFTRRGITNATVSEFILPASKDRTIFTLYDQKSAGHMWVPRSIINYSFDEKGGSLKRFRGDRHASVCILAPSCHPNIAHNWQTPWHINKYPSSVIIMESPIDILSYWQLFSPHLKNNPVLFMATCGSLTVAFLNTIKDKLEALRARNVYINFDNDKAGDVMAEKVISTLEFHKFGRPVKKLGRSPRWEKYKDWNDAVNDKKN